MKRAKLLGQDKGERESQGLAVLEGVRLCEEALNNGLSIEFVLYDAGLWEKPRGRNLMQMLEARGVHCLEAAPHALAAAAQTETPQGVVAVFRPRQWRPDEVKPGLALLADGLQDPGNLGTLIRSAAALGAAGVLLGDGTVDAWNPKVVRAAMGGVFNLPVLRLGTTAALAAMREQGCQVLVADPRGKVQAWEVDFSRPSLLVVGSEAGGASAAARAAADVQVRIPMARQVESLNAATAAALLLYEALRQRRVVRSED